MKTHISTQFCAICALMICLVANQVDLAAQDSEKMKQMSQVSGEIRPNIGQGTNVVSAREVKWVGPHGLEARAYVFHAKGSREMIVAPSTNQVCYLRGKLYSAEVGIQSFSIRTSQLTEASDLTEDAAVDFVVGRKRTLDSLRKEISLKPILASETERHLAQPLILRAVRIKTATGGDNIVVNFESYTGLKGEVVLNHERNPISMAINP